MNPVYMVLTGIFAVLILTLPRPYAAVPFLLCTLYVTWDQMIQIAGQHCNCGFILVIFGALRLMLRNEFYPQETDRITLFIILLAITDLVTDFFLNGLSGDTVRIRAIITVAGLYFYFKSVIRDYDDILNVLKLLPLLVAPIALLMVGEHFTGHNIFGQLGGVSAQSAIRYGKIRCQGPFSHPILAGTFGATIMPAMVALWFQPGFKKTWCIIGAVASLVITVTAGSSGALTTFMLETIGFALWYSRHRMHWVRRGLAALVIVLAVTMKAPIWYLIARLSDLSGHGTGWHRARLLDVAFGQYFHEWWLIGTNYTRHWMPYGLAEYKTKTDVTNQYLGEGIDGGILLMALFIIIIVCCFRALGKALRRNESAPFARRILLWALGVTLFGHAASFMSVSYFDQSIIWYYLLIGSIGALSALPLIPARDGALSP
jgi:hypothetical protein